MTERLALTRVLAPVTAIGLAVSLAAGWPGAGRAHAEDRAQTPLNGPGAVENLLAPDEPRAAGATVAGAGPDDAPPADSADLPESIPVERQDLTMGRGDTLVAVLTDAGLSASEAHYATRALRPVLDPRRLQAGQRLSLVFERRSDRRIFLGAEIPRRQGGFVVLARDGDGFRAVETGDPASLQIAGFGATAVTATDATTQPAAAPPDPAVPATGSRAAEAPAGGALKIDRLELTLGRGGTLAGLMTEAGVSATEAHYAMRALQRVENPRRLMPGQAVALIFERQGNEKRFLGLQMERREGGYAVVSRTADDSFQAIAVADLESLAMAGFGPVATDTLPVAPVLMQQPKPSLAVIPAGAEDADLSHRATLVANGDDSAHEQRYLDVLSLRVERVERTVGRGDTLAGLLSEAGVDRLDAHNAVQSLRGVYDPRRLRAGQKVAMTFETRGEERGLAGFELAPDIETRIVVARTDDGGFAAEAVAKQFQTRLVAAAGTIDSSLYAASNGAGVPDPVLIAVIRAYSFEVDFQRDIRPGDGFELLYEQDYDEDGTLARNGNVLYANLRLRGRDNPMYRFESEDGSVDYYDRDGQSVRRTLMRTPIDGARISSRFGMRRHPILGYSRMHRGTDFAAPSGTPIYAAGSGTIEYLGRNGGYGRYIRIRHNGSLKTAYAHMSGYARGLGRGSRVQQGQVIGYVGTSGRSTGPHLHYEVLMENRQVNPLTLDLPSGRKLEGAELAAFQRIVAAMDERYAEAMIDVQVAQSERD